MTTSCDSCDFTYEDLPPEAVGPTLLAAGPGYRDLLATSSHPALVARPTRSTWSALEYACHVRDVLLVQRDRLVRALVEDRPEFPPMHREERVRVLGYADEAPPLVAEELVLALGLFARAFARLGPPQLQRRCLYGYPTEADVDLAWVGRHTVHEVEHHLLDLRRSLATEPG